VAAGWTDPGFFPLGVWFEGVENWQRLQALNVNLFVGANHSSADIAAFKALPATAGIYFLMDPSEWTEADLGSNGALVPGWLVADEADMFFADPVNDLARIVQRTRAKNDGRFTYANFGKGALGTFWNPENMPVMVQMVDAASDDLYFFTDPNLPYEAPLSDHWPTGATVRQAASYGWTIDRMRSFQGNERRPIWNFVEYSYPWGEAEPADGSASMSPDKIEGAIWASIVREARGILLFIHAFQGAICGGQHTLLECNPDMRARVSLVFSRIRSIAPVLNSQSYAWDTGAPRMNTMLKQAGGFTYLFAMPGHLATTGSKTFSLPGDPTGPAEVLFEARTVDVAGGQLTDGFSSLDTMHVYRVAQ
jgi:hypothetical protein